MGAARPVRRETGLHADGTEEATTVPECCPRAFAFGLLPRIPSRMTWMLCRCVPGAGSRSSSVVSAPGGLTVCWTATRAARTRTVKT